MMCLFRGPITYSKKWVAINPQIIIIGLIGLITIMIIITTIIIIKLLDHCGSKMLKGCTEKTCQNVSLQNPSSIGNMITHTHLSSPAPPCTPPPSPLSKKKEKKKSNCIKGSSLQVRWIFNLMFPDTPFKNSLSYVRNLSLYFSS